MKKLILLAFIFMGVTTLGLSQDTANVIMENPEIGEVPQTTIINTSDIQDTGKAIAESPVIEEVIDTVPQITNTPDIQDSAKVITGSSEVEEVVDSVEVINEPVEESVEETPVNPEVEEVEPVETMSKPEEKESGKVIIVSEKVGEEIDSKEKKEYDLFPDYSKKQFQSAKFMEMRDGSIILQAVMKDGSVTDVPFTKEKFASVKNSIEKEDTPKETVEEVAEETTEDKEKPKKEKANVVDVVYKITGAALIIGAFIIFPF